jgi:hypothetical protein
MIFGYQEVGTGFGDDLQILFALILTITYLVSASIPNGKERKIKKRKEKDGKHLKTC